MAGEVQISIIAIDAASNIIKNIASQFGPFGAAAAAGIGAATGALGMLITKGSEAQDVQERFNSLVDSSALAGYKDEMLALADAISKKTRFEDESVLTAEAQLSIYTNIGQNIFPEVIKQTANLASFMKTDMPSAAQVMGRALADIAGGSLTMLVRQRLLTKEQAEMAKTMAEAGDQEKAQAFILGILNDKIGTLAEDMGTTFAGRMEIFKNTMENIAEDAGMKLLPALAPVIDMLTGLATRVAPLLVTWFGEKVVPIFANLVYLIQTFSLNKIEPPGLLMEFLQRLSDWWATWGPSITEKAGEMWEAIKKGAADVGVMLRDFFAKQLDKIADWMDKNGPMIREWWGRFADLISKIVVPGLVGGVGLMLQFLDFLITKILDVISFMMEFGLKWGDFWGKAAEDVKKAVDDIKKSLADIREFFGGFNGSMDVEAAVSTYRPPGRAKGGPVFKGMDYIVGERGEERFRAPADGYIIPNGSSGGSPVYQFNFPNYVGTRQDLVNMIRGAVRQMQSAGTVPIG